MAVILVSHDLAVIGQTCDDIAVMYAGYVVERGSRDEVINSPRHPYTQALLAAELVFEPGQRRSRLDTIGGQPPDLGDLPPGCPFQQRCRYARPECAGVAMVLDRPRAGARLGLPVRGGTGERVRTAPRRFSSPRTSVKTFPVRRSLTQVVQRAPRQRLIALDDVSLSLYRGQVLGIVGESGSGKSTIAYCLVRLLELDSGRVLIGAEDIARLRGEALRALRRHIQLVFQDPYSSLNPRLTVGRAVASRRGCTTWSIEPARRALVSGLLERCGLRRQDAARYPRQLSGGQRQRVAIARALSTSPDILIADEAVSALDVSVQAQISNLFAELQADLGLGIIFITHQLAVISHLATDVVVLYLGRVMESGPVASVLARHATPTPAGCSRHSRPFAGRGPSGVRRLPASCRRRCDSFRLPVPHPLPVGRADLPGGRPAPVEVSPGHVSRCHVLAPADGHVPSG